jgi:lysophospholipase L1-like esterase
MIIDSLKMNPRPGPSPEIRRSQPTPRRTGNNYFTMTSQIILHRHRRHFLSGLAVVTLFGSLPAMIDAQTANVETNSAARVRRAENRPTNLQLPSLFLIGDSTVRNGQGTGTGGQWGWGDFLAPFFDTNRINVVNRALGGTSSRTFYRDQWPRVLVMLKPGDFVIMQFGHNDASPVNEAVAGPSARARGTIKGVGDETQAITNILTKEFEVVHSFGWYEKQIIAETRSKGATPMVCSLIPRNNWKNGRAARNKYDYAGWSGQVAESENAPFLDINEIIARKYDELGQENVKPLFIIGAGPHTSLAGAETNAACVVAGLKSLPKDPLGNFLSDQGRAVETYQPTGKPF